MSKILSSDLGYFFYGSERNPLYCLSKKSFQTHSHECGICETFITHNYFVKSKKRGPLIKIGICCLWKSLSRSTMSFKCIECNRISDERIWCMRCKGPMIDGKSSAEILFEKPFIVQKSIHHNPWFEKYRDEVSHLDIFLSCEFSINPEKVAILAQNDFQIRGWLDFFGEYTYPRLNTYNPTMKCNIHGFNHYNMINVALFHPQMLLDMYRAGKFPGDLTRIWIKQNLTQIKARVSKQSPASSSSSASSIKIVKSKTVKSKKIVDSTIMPVGKFEGRLMIDLLKKNPMSLLWFHRNIEGFPETHQWIENHMEIIKDKVADPEMIISFGLYKGKLVEEILKEDPFYLKEFILEQMPHKSRIYRWSYFNYDRIVDSCNESEILK